MREEENIKERGDREMEMTIEKKGWGFQTKYIVMLGEVELSRFGSLYECRTACEETFGISPKVI